MTQYAVNQRKVNQGTTKSFTYDQTIFFLFHLDIVVDARTIGCGVFEVKGGEFKHNPEAGLLDGEVVFTVDAVGVVVRVTRGLQAPLHVFQNSSVTN